MRHRKAGKKLGRDSSHREAMFRNMVTSLFKHEQLETTDAKAKQIRPLAEKMITLAKRGDLHARRQALSFLSDKRTAHKLFEDIKDRYLDRQGGYLRIVKKGTRKGDGAPISMVQLLPEDEGKKKAKKKTSTKPRSTAKKTTKTKAAKEKADEPKASDGSSKKKGQGSGGTKDSEKKEKE